MNNLCVFLDWDTRFFGYRTARILEHRTDRNHWSKIEAWCRENTIEVLYFLADFDDRETTRTAESCGFRLVDIRVELETNISSRVVSEGNNGIVAAAVELRDVNSAEISALQAISKGLHKDSRFYYDSKFLRYADLFYQTWIKNSCEGFADRVFVAVAAGQCAGYITVHLDGEGTGHIGLLGVSEDFQGLGIGQELVTHCMKYFCENDVKRVTVVSQGRNVRALRFYQKSGFQVASLRLWYHKWFGADRTPELEETNE